jgi:hypothetical protein
VWKKSAVNQMPHLFDDFRGSLDRLALASTKHRVEENKKKLKELALSIKLRGEDEKFPIHLYHYEKMTKFQLEASSTNLNHENKVLLGLNNQQALELLLTDFVNYNEPEKYR